MSAPLSLRDKQFQSLVATYGPGLSFADMLQRKYGGGNKSTSDLASEVFAGSGSLSDDMYTILGGSGSLTDKMYGSSDGGLTGSVTNILSNPTPNVYWGAGLWMSNDPTKWAVTFSSGVINVQMLVPADANYISSLYNHGAEDYSPDFKVGVNYQRSFEIKSDVPCTITPDFGAYKGYEGGQSIPANIWTKVVEQFIYNSSFPNVMAFSVTSPGATAGNHVQLRKGFLAENSSGRELAYADGNSPGWKWNGAANGSPSSGPPIYEPIATIDQWMSTTPFFAGHRGEWMGYPEHSAESYAGAFADGAQALEWSIQPNSQGVFYHMHDIGGATGLNRTTNGTGDVSGKTTAEMDALIIDIADAGPYWPTANIRVPKFLSMMALYFKKVVILLESKDYTNPAIDALFAILDSQFPGYQQSIIWKQHVGGAGSVPYGMQQAALRNMKIWAYIDAPLVTQEMNDAIARGTYVGIPRSDTGGGNLSDADVDTVIAAAGSKKVLAWNPTRRSTVDLMITKGVDGFVSPAIRYTRQPYAQRQVASDFASGRWSVGDHNCDSSRILSLTSGQNYARFANTLSGQSCCLGSLCPTPASGYAIVYEVSYEVLPTAANFCGLAFGKASDAFFQIGQTTNPDGGYVLQSKGDTALQLTRHLPNSATNTAIGTAITAAWAAGAYMKVKVVVNAGDIKFQRQDGTPSAVITVTDTTYRGGYLYLVRNHGAGGGEICRFRNIQYTTDLNFL